MFWICQKLFCFQLDCCGWLGPSDFAYNSEPIDDSCYENLGGNSGILARPSTDNGFDSTKKMKQVIHNFFWYLKGDINYFEKIPHFRWTEKNQEKNREKNQTFQFGGSDHFPVGFLFHCHGCVFFLFEQKHESVNAIYVQFQKFVRFINGHLKIKYSEIIIKVDTLFCP